MIVIGIPMRVWSSPNRTVMQSPRVWFVLFLSSSAALQLGGRPLSRRDLLQLGAAALAAPASAYDTVPQPSADLAALEAKRAARTQELKLNKKRIKPYLDAIAESTTPVQFSEAADKLSLWIIGEGELPAGIEAAGVRDEINDAYDALPKKGFSCEPTRTNNGFCYSPGPPADDAYLAALKQLRKYSTRKGKGSLQSDGVSAANSAAF